MRYVIPFMMLLSLFCISSAQARHVYVYGGGGAVVVGRYHDHWWHENVCYSDPWYCRNHTYVYNGAPYPVYYNGYPYYYYDPRFYYY